MNTKPACKAFRIIIEVLIICALVAVLAVMLILSARTTDVGTLSTARVKTKDTMTALVDLDTLNLPSSLTDQSTGVFGLYVYNGTDWVTYDNPSFTFDPNKETMITIHGMGYGTTWYNEDTFFKDYNVCSFWWSKFADEGNLDMAKVAAKDWFGDGDMRYKANGEWQSGEDIHVSVTEIFAAYYLKFFSKYLNTNYKPVTIMGHSYGGMMTCGIMSYLVTAYDCGLLDARYLPDNFLLLDPYLMACSPSQKINWLGINNPVDKGGIVYLTELALIRARELGISVALFRTADYVEYPLRLALDSPIISDNERVTEFKSHLLYVYAPAWGTITSDMSEAHVYAIIWPAYGGTSVTYDSNDPTQYAFSIYTPYWSDFARVGNNYTLDYNGTKNIYTDDTFTSTNITSSKICGYAYYDTDGNGEMNERICDHFAGLKVVVTDKDGNEVLNTVTGKNGYYEVNVAEGTYTVTVTAPKGYKVEKTTDTVTVKGDKQLGCSTFGLTK